MEEKFFNDLQNQQKEVEVICNEYQEAFKKVVYQLEHPDGGTRSDELKELYNISNSMPSQFNDIENHFRKLIFPE